MGNGVQSKAEPVLGLRPLDRFADVGLIIQNVQVSEMNILAMPFGARNEHIEAGLCSNQ